MKDYPNAFWAVIFIFMAATVAVLALFAPTKDNVTMAVITFASNIAAGSFGYIQGKHEGAAQLPPPSPPAVTDPNSPKQ